MDVATPANSLCNLFMKSQFELLGFLNYQLAKTRAESDDETVLFLANNSSITNKYKMTWNYQLMSSSGKYSLGEKELRAVFRRKILVWVWKTNGCQLVAS